MSSDVVNIPMVNNARLTDIAPTVVSEQIGNYISFFYDAVLGAARLTFNSQAFVYVAGDPHPLTSTLTDTLESDVASIQTRCFGVGLRDPVTGIDLDGISVAGIEIIFKNAFDMLYNERAIAQGNPMATAPLSEQAMVQANQLYDYFGMGEAGYPLGKVFGGPGVTLPPSVGP